MCGTDLSDLQRILHYAMTVYIFQESNKGYVKHTARSRQLVDHSLLRDRIAFLCSEEWRASTRLVDAAQEWPSSEEPEHSAWALVNGASEPIFAAIQRFPDRASRIPGAMALMDTQEGYEIDYLVDAIDWTGVKTFVDVGGAHGSVSIKLARAFDSTTFIVQDLPRPVSTAQVPQDLRSRVSFIVHDFHTPQPIHSADIYFFRWVFHDWSDKYAMGILKNIVPALKHGARLIINEFLLPELGKSSYYQEQSIR